MMTIYDALAATTLTAVRKPFRLPPRCERTASPEAAGGRLFLAAASLARRFAAFGGFASPYRSSSSSSPRFSSTESPLQRW